MDYNKLSRVCDSKIKDEWGAIVTIGPILEGYKAEEIGNGDGKAGALEYARGLDFSEYTPERDDIKNREYVDSLSDIDIFYDGAGDYYFFSPNDMGVGDYVVFDSKIKDSADVEFYIDEDDVYDLIHDGTTSVAIPSGADTKAFVAAVEDILKEIASECGYKGLKIETAISGNVLNIYKK